TAHCTNCGRMLPETGRAPCPDCGRTERTYKEQLTAVATATVTLKTVTRRTREYVEHHWPWFAVSVVVTVVGLIVGVFTDGVVAVVVAVLLAAIGYPIARRAEVSVRETVERQE